MEVERDVRLRIEPRKEFLYVSQKTEQSTVKLLSSMFVGFSACLPSICNWWCMQESTVKLE